MVLKKVLNNWFDWVESYPYIPYEPVKDFYSVNYREFKDGNISTFMYIWLIIVAPLLFGISGVLIELYTHIFTNSINEIINVTGILVGFSLNGSILIAEKFDAKNNTDIYVDRITVNFSLVVGFISLIIGLFVANTSIIFLDLIFGFIFMNYILLVLEVIRKISILSESGY